MRTARVDVSAGDTLTYHDHGDQYRYGESDQRDGRRRSDRDGGCARVRRYWAPGAESCSVDVDYVVTAG